MRVVNRRHPVAHGFVDGFFESRLTCSDRAHFGPHQTHACDIERLAFHVDGAHVDHAFHAKARADGRGSNAMLTRAGLGDDAFFAEPLGEENLPEGVVDLMRAGVEQVFALEINFGTAQFLRPALGEIQRRRATDIVVKEVVEFGVEGRIIFCRLIRGGQFLKRGHQRLGHEHAAKLSVVAGSIGQSGRR